MSTDTHTCVFFDDGGHEHRCPCGELAIVQLEDGHEVLVRLGADTATPIGTVSRLASGSVQRHELAISA